MAKRPLMNLMLRQTMMEAYRELQAGMSLGIITRPFGNRIIADFRAKEEERIIRQKLNQNPKKP